jgi:hypothetical protein
MFLHEVGCTIPKRSKHKYQCSGNPDKPISNTSGEKTEAKILDVHVKSLLCLSPSVGVCSHSKEKEHWEKLAHRSQKPPLASNHIERDHYPCPEEEKERLKKKKKRNKQPWKDRRPHPAFCFFSFSLATTSNFTRSFQSKETISLT